MCEMEEEKKGLCGMKQWIKITSLECDDCVFIDLKQRKNNDNNKKQKILQLFSRILHDISFIISCSIVLLFFRIFLLLVVLAMIVIGWTFHFKMNWKMLIWLGFLPTITPTTNYTQCANKEYQIDKIVKKIPWSIGQYQ